mgnify:CR=1 FL=1
MITIGRKDRIDLPELNLLNLEAKIDTGAFGCAIHCHDIKVVSLAGRDTLQFDLLDPEHPDYEKEIFQFSEFGKKTVKSTNGESEDRYTIVSDLIVFNTRYQVEFSLTNRADMRTPVLLGRKFLSKRFIVDVAKKDLSYKLKKKENRSSVEKL